MFIFIALSMYVTLSMCATELHKMSPDAFLNLVTNHMACDDFESYDDSVLFSKCTLHQLNPKMFINLDPLFGAIIDNEDIVFLSFDQTEDMILIVKDTIRMAKEIQVDSSSFLKDNVDLNDMEEHLAKITQKDNYVVFQKQLVSRFEELWQIVSL
jgi:hypothetical protein